MAQKRMFSLQIVDTDAFLEMPMSSQLLYFHLAMRADDEGFVGNPKKIIKIVGSNEDDFKILVGKRFLLTFESGVVVIKHWLIHNTIRMDRFNPTKYEGEKQGLTTKENGAYTERQPVGNQLATQVKLSEVKLSEINTAFSFEDFWNLYPKKVEKKKTQLKWIRLNEKDKELIMADLPNRIKSDSWQKGFILNPMTYLNGERWNDEPLKSMVAPKIIREEK